MSLAMPIFAQVDAEDEPALSPEAQRLQDELEIRNRERDLRMAEKELLETENAILREKWKVPALSGIGNETSFAGEGAGKLELGMVGGDVLFAMADGLAKRFEAQDKKVILLAGSENIQLPDPGLVRTEIAVRDRELRDRLGRYSPLQVSLLDIPKGLNGTKSVLGAGALFLETLGAVAKAVSVERTVSNAPFQATDAQLVRLLGGTQGVIRPDSKIAVSENHALLTSFNEFRRTIAAADRLTEPKKGSPTKAAWDRLQIELTLAKALEKRLLTPTEQGDLPLYVAARYEDFFKEKPLVATVWSDWSAGTFVTRKSFSTRFLGKDGSNMAAGMAMNYTIVDPATGQTKEAGLIRCMSAYTTMTEVMAMDIGGTDNGALVPASCRTRYR